MTCRPYGPRFTPTSTLSEQLQRKKPNPYNRFVPEAAKSTDLSSLLTEELPILDSEFSKDNPRAAIKQVLAIFKPIKVVSISVTTWQPVSGPEQIVFEIVGNNSIIFSPTTSAHSTTFGEFAIAANPTDPPKADNKWTALSLIESSLDSLDKLEMIIPMPSVPKATAVGLSTQASTAIVLPSFIMRLPVSAMKPLASDSF